MIREPTTMAEALAGAVGGGLAWALESVVFVTLLAIMRMPKLRAAPIGASLTGFLQAGTLSERFIRASCLGAATLAACAGAHLRFQLCAATAAVSVATVLGSKGKILPEKPFGRVILIIGTVALAAVADGAGQLYLPDPPTRGEARRSTDAESAPRTVTSRDGLLGVTLPSGASTPSRSDTVVNGPFGKVVVTTYAADGPSGDAYIVSVSDFPVSAFESASPKELLDGWRDSYLAGVTARMISQEDLLLGGCSGRRPHFESAEPGAPLFGRVECYLAKPHLCQVAYVSPTREAVSTPAVDAFFSSVRLKAAR